MELVLGPLKREEIRQAAALDREGLQTMRTLANNMAALLRATGGKPMPGSDEPWDGMHFIR